MCGIAGISIGSNITNAEDFQQEALDKIQYRGPDNQSSLVINNTVLCHTRLSIIDPSDSGNQPFQDAEKKYTLIYNGEVFNFFELKNELIQLGYSFTTQTDTEVVLHYLIEHGKEGLKHLNGFFALAFYDHENDELLLARDRSGIKPLYYRVNKDTLVFASDMGVMTQQKDKQLNLEAAFQYFKFTYSPSDFTLLKDTHKLQPGNYLIWKGQSIKEHQGFGAISPEKNPGNDLKEIIERAVVNRLVADVPLGSFLSGGIDSSIVSAIAQKNTLDLNTYSVGFKGLSIDESEYAEEVAQHIGTAHHKVWITEEEFRNELDTILDCFDEPFADSSSVAMYFLCKTASKDLRVALSGDGADELLGGYRKHRAFLKAQHQSHLFTLLKPLHLFTKNSSESRIGKWGDISRKVNRFMQLKGLTPEERYWHLASFHENESVQNLFIEHVKPGHPYPIDSNELQSNFNYFLLQDQKNVLPNDMLKKVDLMSMHNNMEVRPIFLDDYVIEYCNALPAPRKIDLKTGKKILRDLFKDDLPPSIFKRKKQGFEIPLENWLYHLADDISNKPYFSKEYLSHQKIFNTSQVKSLFKAFKEGQKKHASLIWTLLVFQHWHYKSFDNQ